jgi:putative FmdB family regulatory protein
MPLYAYACADCGPFAEFRPIAEFAAPQPCPACARPAARQLTESVSLGSSAASAGPLPRSAAAPRHRAGCGCCTPPVRRSLKAEAAGGGRAKPASFLDRA